MRFRIPSWGRVVVCALTLAAPSAAHAATITVPAGGDLQAALDAAQDGDVILLEPGATFVGNFKLPNKVGVTRPIVIRSAAADALLPGAGVRMTPAYAAQLPKIRSVNTMSSLRTAAGAHHWTLQFLEFQANQLGYGEIISLGAGDSTQSALSQVPHTIVLDRVYVHGDPLVGQKRGIALHSRDTAIINSYVSDCKLVGQDSQAISGFNGPGNYIIENNYLEGAGENFLLGGADPVIPNLVTTNVVFRRNHLRKPLEWRDPVVTPVSNLSASPVAGGGALAAGTYTYRVAARRVTAQSSKATSASPVEVAATVGQNGAVTITWTPVSGADDYIVYGRQAGAQNVYWKTTASVFTDTGAAGTSGTPANASRWAAKNLFELKNAQDVLVEGNVMENNWVGDQPGFAVVFTPRNQDGRAPWAVVQRVMFRQNLVRHTAGGVNILGRDNLSPSQRTNHITIEHNVFDDLTSAVWGAGSRFLQIGDGPDAVVVNHNTVITTTSAVVWLYGGSASAPVVSTNVVYTNNMSRHNSYGIMGANSSPGIASIAAFLPGGIVDRNVLAGGTASKYPAGNFFPTTAAWQTEFVDYAGGDYRLAAASQFRGAGTDGGDLGADVPAVQAQAANALSGNNSLAPGTSQVQILTSALPNGLMNQAYAESLACTGGESQCAWVVHEQSLPAGLAFDAVAAVVSGVPSEPGSGSITVEAFDPASPANSATKTLQLTVEPPPFTIAVPNTASGRVGESFQLLPAAAGAVGNVAWSISVGSLPEGMTMDGATGGVTGVPAAWGTSTTLMRAQDSWAPERTAEQPVTFTIAPASLQVVPVTLAAGLYGSAYSAALITDGGTGAAAWGLTGGALPLGMSLGADGALSGVPLEVGTFAFAVEASDLNWPGYTAQAGFALTVSAPALVLTIPAPAAGLVGESYLVTPVVAAGLGVAAWSVSSGSLPPGTAIDAATGVVAGTPTAAGTFVATIRVVDQAANLVREASADLSIVVAPAPIVVISEIVLHAERATVVGSAWQRVADQTAAGGYRMLSPDKGAAKLGQAKAAPASYLEMTFEATAGVSYHVWVRGKAEKNYWGNDSVYVQFSSTVTGLGAPDLRIGTTAAMSISIENAINAGLSGWGWQDGAYGSLDKPIVFANAGLQTIRIQVREDGVSLDQIVLSAASYFSQAPGVYKNDTTILAATGAGSPVGDAPGVAEPPAPVADLREIVLHAADVAVAAGTWQKVADSSAASGHRLWNANGGAAKVAAPLASPVNYFELTFEAQANLPYQVWLRGKADNNTWSNDSVYVQFTNSATEAGAAAFRIGTSSALTVSIEDATGAGVSGWGWQDGAFAALAEPIVFATTGPQTVRIQVREDGLSIDQVVLSSDRHLTVRPGSLKNDTTILTK